MAKIIFVYKGRYFVRDTETISYLSAIARSAGYRTELVYDEDTFGTTDNVFYQPLLNKVFSSSEKLAMRIADGKPSMAVFLVNFNNKSWVEEISRHIKSFYPEVKIIAVSPLGDKVDGVDAVILGEAEKSFADFLGVAGRRGDDFLPDKDLFARYVDFSLSYMVYTSKGCVGNCSYCEETIYKDKFGAGYYRWRSPENVIKELQLAKEKYNPREIIFKDSVFALDKNWLKKFLEIYRRQIQIPYKCFGKADVFDEEIAYELKSGGCYCVEFGVQTLNDKIRQEILYRRETVDDIERALAVCDRYRLTYDIDHMFGLPGETIADHKEAMRFYYGLKCLNRIKCHNLVVYPHSEIKKFCPAGSVEDFFSGVAGAGKMKEVNRAFEKIFKVLPLLPGRLVNFLLKENNWKIFGFIPTVLIILGQVIIAAKNHDQRFKVYSRMYPKKIWQLAKGW